MRATASSHSASRRVRSCGGIDGVKRRSSLQLAANASGAGATPGIPADDVRNGLATWHAKGLHPSALASIVHEVRTAADRRSTPKAGRSTTDERVAATLDLAARYAAAEGATPPAIGA